MMISLTVLGINFVGDALRDALDPTSSSATPAASAGAA